VRARTQKQLAYERRRREERTRKQKRAAKLLGLGMTQEQAALELAVTSRTLRNWKTAPAFRRELERQHKHAARQPTLAPSGSAKAPARRAAADSRRR
jgi:hypothetical protein